MRRQGFFFQRRWFAAVYITVAIFILLLISFVFYWFHARTMEDLKASQTEVLNNTSTVFQSQLDSFSLAAYQLYAMPASTVLLANPEDPVSFIIDFSKQGQSIMASNDLIDIVALFDEEEMVLTRQKRVISQDSMNALHEKAVSVAQTLFYLEADRMAYGTPVRMLCTVVGDRSGSSWEQGVLLCVNADELADRLLSQLDYTYILDQDGNVLLSSQPELFGQQLPGYQQLLADFEKKGNPSAILTQLDGQESLVCVASCPESSFQVISIQPVSQLQENLNRGLWQLFAATAFILSVAGVITLLLSKFLSRPADDLLKEIANLPPAPGTKAQAPMDPQLAHTMLLRTAHTIDQLQVVHRKDQQIQYLLGLTQDLSPQALFPTDSGWFLAVLQSDQPPRHRRERLFPPGYRNHRGDFGKQPPVAAQCHPACAGRHSRLGLPRRGRRHRAADSLSAPGAGPGLPLLHQPVPQRPGRAWLPSHPLPEHLGPDARQIPARGWGPHHPSWGRGSPPGKASKPMRG